MRRVAVYATCALWIASGCAEATPRTQVMLVIDAEPAVARDARVLYVHVLGGLEGQPTTTYASRYVRSHPEPAFPFRVAMVPLELEPARGWLATVETRDEDGTARTRSTLRGGYAPERTKRLDLQIDDACASVLCEGQRCERGACVDGLVHAPSLPDLVLDAGL